MGLKVGRCNLSIDWIAIMTKIEYPSKELTKMIGKPIPDEDVERNMNCNKCGEELVERNGELACPHCRAKRGKCDGCGHVTPIFDGMCDACRSNKRKQEETKARWGERKGSCIEFCARNAMCMVVTIGSFSLLAIAAMCMVPLIADIKKVAGEVEHDMAKLIDDVHGGVAPMLDEGGRILGYAGRNTASAMRLLETPLNFTESKLEDAESIIKKIFQAIESPSAAFMAYNRVTGTTIICDDGTEYSWKPMVMKSGIVQNPYSGCVLHQMKLNDESHARFFPGPPPKHGDPILAEKTIEKDVYNTRTRRRGDHGPPRAEAMRGKRSPLKDRLPDDETWMLRL